MAAPAHKTTRHQAAAPTIAVGHATAEHVPQLVDLGPRIFANAVRELAPFDAAAWQMTVPHLLKQPGHRVSVALDGGRVVGVHMVAASPVLFAPTALVVRTLTMWIDPSARGQGLATRLQRAAEDWGRAIGACRMMAGVPHRYDSHAALGDERATSEAAESFYRSCGYVSAEANLIKEIFPCR
jgi:GNAT superfamily N-acetyltransferase